MTPRRCLTVRHDVEVRLSVRVYPASKRTRVGGRYGSTEPPVLMVRVTAPATDGRANDAVVQALSAALELPRRNVRIISGATSRTKVLDLQDANPQAVAALLAASS